MTRKRTFQQRVKEAEAARKLRAARKAGTYEPPLVSPARAREHIADLRAYGISYRSIAKLAGLHLDQVNRIVAPHRTQRIHRLTERKILAVRFNLDTLPDDAQVDMIGSRRRIRALVRIGWPQNAIAAWVGLSHSHLNKLTTYHAQQYVTVDFARRIRDVYDNLGLTPGPSERAMKRAEKLGWPPPMAWDDDTIDHPDTKPDLACLRRTGEHQTSEETLEDIMWILQYEDRSMTMRQLGDRLGVTRDGIARVFVRATDRRARRLYDETIGQGCVGPLTEEAQEEADALMEEIMAVRHQVYENTEAAGFNVSQRAS